ncbi:MAG: molybdopterin converting factor subunit 1 [Chitinophagaceae bacterium]|jgi:molybdopterin synthase sulfur carrier subunit|nr:MAG: molybdopterin converting factor subunit 1 [Chitinophagaceae bacterium]
MEIRLLAFGIVKEIFKVNLMEISLPEGSTVDVLRKNLEHEFPAIKRLSTYMIAVNNEYAAEDVILKAQDEIAIIPPVSGG